MPPHPADQFEAFAKLARNSTPEAIASRFGISTGFVRQRLKLAKVSRRLLGQYRSGAMTLDQLMAFTISEDHALQEQVWFEYPNADIDPSYIRRQLTQTQVPASDRRARFVGAKAYEAAGGVILRDLFDSREQGYFSDSQLLDRLVAEKLQAAAQAIRAEGWSWVEVMPEADYHHLADFGRIQPSEVDLSPEEEEKLAGLAERYDDLVASMEESDEGEDALNAIDAELNLLRARKETWTEADRACAGAIVSLEHDGTVLVTRGLAREEPAEQPDAPDRTTQDEKKEAKMGYSDTVLLDLSAHRTAALRASVAGNPDVAFLVLLYALVSGLFFGYRSQCVEIAAIHTDLDRASQTVAESKASRALLEHAEHWKARVPGRDALWPWLQSLEGGERQALMAYCVSLALNALTGAGGVRVRESEDIADLAGLNMLQWWEPSPAFFSHLTKVQILAAVSEAVSPEAARLLADLKKSSLIERATELLAGKAWLPESLRKTVI